jgi:RNA polymerase-binding transcription factor DksA
MTHLQKIQFKRALERVRQELMREIRNKTAELAIVEDEHDPLDQLQSMSRRDEAVTMLDKLSHTLAAVDESLRAMSESCYGLCEECGEPIAL